MPVAPSVFLLLARALSRPVRAWAPAASLVTLPVVLAAVVIATPAEAQAETSAPSDLQASHDSCGVALTWSEPSADAAQVTGYRILRGATSATLTTLVADSGLTDSAYHDAGAARGESYAYAVQALRGSSVSAQSNTVEISVPATPTATAVTVDAVPVVVASTTADYFVLYASFEVDGTELEFPVAVVRGEAGTTTLEENVEALPKERYRVEQYLVADPADVDGDCIDDITELDNLGDMNPVNPAPGVPSRDGAVAIPDWAAFESLAHDNQGKLYVTYVQFDIHTSHPGLYFLNTSKYPFYGDFVETIGRISDAYTRIGTITYDPDLTAPNGNQGVIYFTIGAYGDYLSLSPRTYTLLSASMPIVDNDLSWHVENHRLLELQPELPWLRASRWGLVFDIDVSPDITFSALNATEGYGRLRSAIPGYQPNSLDIMIYETPPTTLPRVAGIISTTPQTPLSPLNLRALQSGVPSAVITDALSNSHIAALLGRFVKYEVSEYGGALREATSEEAEHHYESSTPPTEQTAARDLSVETIAALSGIGFNDRTAFPALIAKIFLDSTALACTKAICRTLSRKRSTGHSRECLPACGPSGRSPNGSFIVSTIFQPQWACWCILISQPDGPGDLQSALTR